VDFGLRLLPLMLIFSLKIGSVVFVGESEALLCLCRQENGEEEEDEEDDDMLELKFIYLHLYNIIE